MIPWLVLTITTGARARKAQLGGEVLAYVW